MSTDLTISNMNVPAHLAGRVGKPSALGENMGGGLSSGDFPRISIKGGRFRTIEDGVETVLANSTLEVAIVGANPRLSKTYYAGAWSQDNEPSAPDCYSLDGISPHAEAESPENDLCATCKQNAWGSKVTPDGKKIKACADQKRLAVVAADDPTGPVYLLQVTPAALRPFQAYHKKLSQHGLTGDIVRTIVSFDTDASFPKMKFDFGGYLDEEAQKAVDNLINTKGVLEITGEAGPAVTVASDPTPAKPQLVHDSAKEAAPVEEAAPIEEVATASFGKKAEAVEEAPASKPKADPKKAAPAEVVKDDDGLVSKIEDILAAETPADDE